MIFRSYILRIGLAIAERLGHEGCQIVISSRRQKNVDSALDTLVKSGLDRSNLAGVECHVANEEHRKRLIKFAVDRFGRIDILINNAGMFNSIITDVCLSQESIQSLEI